MEFTKETRSLSQIDADLLVVLVYQDEKPAELLKQLDGGFTDEFAARISDECTRDNFSGKTGQMVLVPTFGQLAAKRLLLRGVGKKNESDASTVRKALGGAARKFAAGTGSNTVAVELRVNDNAALAQAAVEGWLLGSYQFKKYKTKDDDKKPGETQRLQILSAVDDSAFAAAVKRGATIADATRFARDMVAEPPAHMTPTRLAELSSEIANDGVTCQIIDRQEAESMGMGAFLGVARGAGEPPKFIVMRYMHPEAKKTIAIAGKGITFDSGGLSIKNAQSMEHMKYDMTGAAVVIATMKAIAELRPKINVTAVAVATENMVGPTAMHPGDIVTALNGKTIEVNNTDAEGRLVLADALSYLNKEKPDEIIDLATLTGAAVTALGRAAAAIMGNDDGLIQRIISTGTSAGEKYWQLPLMDEYKEFLKSDVADLKNAGARGEAGSSAGGMFLMEFVDGKPWAHLDIAGPAWLDKEKDELNKGGTAFGVRTLCYYLLDQAAK